MVKSYLRYAEKKIWGVVASRNVNVVYTPDGHSVLTGALHQICVWSVGTGELELSIGDEAKNGSVTVIALSPSATQVAAGYEDGSVRIWELSNGKCLMTLSGHKSSISCLSFSPNTSHLVSGSLDTQLVVWDLMGECGVARFKGHKSRVSQCAVFYPQKEGEKGNEENDSSSQESWLVSSSTDGVLKVWSLNFFQCVQTVVGHRGELWDFVINKDQNRLYTCSQNGKLFVYDIDLFAKEESQKVDAPSGEREILKLRGSINRKTNEKIVSMSIKEGLQVGGEEKGPGDLGSYGILACQAIGREVEFLKIHEPKEVARRRRRRHNRAKKKKEKKDESAWNEDDEAASKDEDNSLNDELSSVFILKCTAKVVSLDLHPKKLECVVSTQDNKFETYSIIPPAGSASRVAFSASISSSVHLPGHRTDVRALALNSDNTLLASSSRKEVKVWNVASQKCIQTMKSGFGLCISFLPGDRHVVVGTKEGVLEIFSLSSGVCVWSANCHESSSVWALQLTPDNAGLISGGADKTIRFWNFQLQANEEGKKSLQLKAVRAMKMSDDVLALRLSSDGVYLAAALLDNTVKVFFADTLKFFLSLYGHKLPVLSLDISSDSTLIATASSDKNIKIWGTDFGDCHKSIFAHEGAIMKVKFVKKTHYFFSVGKDFMVKYWDADTFQLILTLPGHTREVWAMDVSSNGNFVVTAAHDFSLRIWARSDEQVFLEEEREKAMENKYNEEVVGEEFYDPTEEGATDDVGRAGVRTLESVKSGEKLLIALELCVEEDKKQKKYLADLEEWDESFDRLVKAGLVQEEKRKTMDGRPPEPEKSALLMKSTPSEYLFKILTSIPSPGLEDALLMVPFSYVVWLLGYLNEWIGGGCRRPEFISRCVFFLVHVHLRQIVASPSLNSLLSQLVLNVRETLNDLKSDIGFNKVAIGYVGRWLDMNDQGRFLLEEKKEDEDEEEEEEESENDDDEEEEEEGMNGGFIFDFGEEMEIGSQPEEMEEDLVEEEKPGKKEVKRKKGGNVKEKEREKEEEEGQEGEGQEEEIQEKETQKKKKTKKQRGNIKEKEATQQLKRKDRGESVNQTKKKKPRRKEM